MMMKKLLLSSLLSLSLFASIEEDATTLIEQGEYLKASSVLDKQYQTGEYTNQTLFLLGLTSREMGNYSDAISYFSELLLNDNTLGRVKLELALAYAKEGSKQKALDLLEEVKATNPPAEVVEKITIIEEILAGKTAKAWSASISVGVMLDDNVNVGPISDTITVNNNQFIIASNQMPRPDTALVVSANLSYVKPFLEKLAWINSISTVFNEYEDTKNRPFDMGILNIQSGLSYLSERVRVDLPVESTTLKVGEPDYFFVTYGVSPKITYMLNDTVNMGVASKFFQKDYKSLATRQGLDTRVMQGDGFVNYTLFPELSFNAHANYKREKSATRALNNSAYSFTGGAYYVPIKNVSIYAQMMRLRTSYTETNTIFNVRQVDISYNYYLNMSYAIKPYIDSTLSVSYNRFRNISTIDRFTFTRNQYTLMLSKSF
jgi:tetratricopeptide (TPR) repeat protein